MLLLVLFILNESRPSTMGGDELEFSTITPVPGDSTPFALKVRAYNLNPVDTNYEFCVWVYDTANSCISRMWAQNKWGYYDYQPFYSDTGADRYSWLFMRIYKEHSDSFYIKFKYRNSNTAEITLGKSAFQIMNMDTSGGWLQGIVYKDSALSQVYENIIVIAKDSSGHPIGAYISENNNISEDGDLPAGGFSLAAPAGKVYSLEFQTLDGKSVSGWLKSIPPYEISPCETTCIDSNLILYNNSSVTLMVSPQVFSPQNAQNICSISYNLPFTKATVKLYIYDRRGRCVRTLANNLSSGAKNTYIWNGKNDRGESLPIGIYIIYLSASDELSDRTISKKVTVVLAKKLH